MHRRGGWEKLDFAAALADEDSRLAVDGDFPLAHRDAGLYATHLERWEQFVGRDQMLVLLTEDLDRNPVEICQRIFTFLGVDESFVPLIGVKYNTKEQFGITSQPEAVGMSLRHSPPGRLIARMFPQRVRRSIRMKLTAPTFRPGFGEVGEDVKQQLRDSYRTEILALQERYGFDLTDWMSGSR